MYFIRISTCIYLLDHNPGRNVNRRSYMYFSVTFMAKNEHCFAILTEFIKYVFSVIHFLMNYIIFAL